MIKHLALCCTPCNQTIQPFTAGIYPASELVSSPLSVSSVQLLQQRGCAQRTQAEVICKAHQRVELSPGDFHLHQLINALLILHNAAFQQPIGSRLINLHTGADFLTVYWLCPPVTYRPDAHRILIGFQPQTFEALDQLNAVLLICILIAPPKRLPT